MTNDIPGLVEGGQALGLAGQYSLDEPIGWFVLGFSLFVCWFLIGGVIGMAGRWLGRMHAPND